MSGKTDFYMQWLGIPEGDRPPDHYQLLRLVRFEDDLDRIRAHYRKLNTHVRKYATGPYSVQSQDILNELARAMLLLTDPVRKREYDQSLGRDFDNATGGERSSVTEYMVEHAVISREQAGEIEDFAQARGLTTRDAVVQMKLAEPDVATRAFAHELGLPYVDVEDMLPDDDVLDQFPRNVVRRHSILPLFVDDGFVLVACADEPTQELEDDVRLRIGIPMRGAMAVPRSVKQGIAKYYAPGVREESTARSDSTAKSSGKGKQTVKKATGGRRKTMGELSSGEQKQRQQIGTIVLLWSLIVSLLLFWYALLPYVGVAAAVLISVAMFGSGVYYVTKVYWK